jgi:hypothetical protein
MAAMLEHSFGGWTNMERRAQRAAERREGPIRFRTTFRNVIYDVFKARGWRETDSETEWDVAWVDPSWLREFYDAMHLDEQQVVRRARRAGARAVSRAGMRATLRPAVVHARPPPTCASSPGAAIRAPRAARARPAGDQPLSQPRRAHAQGPALQEPEADAALARPRGGVALRVLPAHVRAARRLRALRRGV